MELYYLITAVIVPAFCAFLSLFFRKDLMRKVLVAASSTVLIFATGVFYYLLKKNGGEFAYQFTGPKMDELISKMIMVFDFILLAYMIYLGFKLKKPLIWIFSLIQGLTLGYFELTNHVQGPKYNIHVDTLSLVMVLLISIIGPMIVIFAVGYMKEHEEHLHLKITRQPRFFAVLLVFLAAMNGLVLTGNLLWMYFFWEITTLCSFWLISHDGTEEATNNAARALWMNSLGGVAFVFGIVLIYFNMRTIDVFEVISIVSFSNIPALALGIIPGIALLTFAGFTKSAQFPFQNWLLGAMVAPTPVSALLHSSTMVKAGVYLVIRISPAYQGTMLAKIIALVGGISFLAGAALALTQRNAKKVLAYSTIANLGLIIACAGIGTQAALAAAILLIIFHALSKGLLFLCVGTIEQKIGSRDIEDMHGIMRKLPFTTIVAVIGMLTMVLPPFGMLLTKWMAMEAAVNSPVLLILIVLGSALTVAFWAKWIGTMLTLPSKNLYDKDNLAGTMKSTLGVLAFLTVMTTVLVAPVYNWLVAPYVNGLYYLERNFIIVGGSFKELVISSTQSGILGGFSVFGFLVVLFAIAIYIPYFKSQANSGKERKPFLCGENTEEEEGSVFLAPGDTPVASGAGNYYLKDLLSENKLTLWFTIIAGLMILAMFGGAWKW